MKPHVRTILPLMAATCLLLVLSGVVWAKPNITVTLAATKEVAETRNGVKTFTTVSADSAVSGDIITYTITYSNTGNETAVNAVIDNPVSGGMSYIDNSAIGKDAEILFSIDGGRTYKKPLLLSYEIKQTGGRTEIHTARPEEYTHIRWVISSIPAGAAGKVSCKVKVR